MSCHEFILNDLVFGQETKVLVNFENERIKKINSQLFMKLFIISLTSHSIL